MTENEVTGIGNKINFNFLHNAILRKGSYLYYVSTDTHSSLTLTRCTKSLYGPTRFLAHSHMRLDRSKKIRT